MRTLNDLNQEELQNLFVLIEKTRRAMKDILGIEKVSFVQEDGPDGMHFHPWFFPWYAWMNELGLEGSDTSKIRKIMEYSRNHLRNEKNLKKIHSDVQSMRSAY